MSWIITGGAGFIGSCLLARLNAEGYNDIIITDNISNSEKWVNIANKQFRAYYPKNDFLNSLECLSNPEGIIHLGACSSTKETDFDYLYKNNYQYSVSLFQFCTKRRIPFIYASSASVYGDGSKGFCEAENTFKLQALNRYGFSKLIFDRWVCTQNHAPPQCVGLRFFNVYGPNEYHKGSMASMIYHGYNQITSTGKMKLFKSKNSLVPDGEQVRDFIFVDDVCSIIIHFMNHSEYSGIFNVGTGCGRSFNELASSLFSTLNITPNIEYIDMPSELIQSYQYYTEADISKLRNTNYTADMVSLENGINEYVSKYLQHNNKVL